MIDNKFLQKIFPHGLGFSFRNVRFARFRVYFPLVLSILSLGIAAVLLSAPPEKVSPLIKGSTDEVPTISSDQESDLGVEEAASISNSKDRLLLSPTPTLITPPIPDPTSTPDPTATPLPVVDTPTPTPTPEPPITTVTVEISSPDGVSTFPVGFTAGTNVCDLLQKAKNEGKLKSLTIDYDYLKTFKSAYVLEINGCRNNWVFTANGTSPLGCSLYQPKSGALIVWKYL